MEVIDKIKTLMRQMLPNGLAFRHPLDGYQDGLQNALAISEAQCYEDAMSVLFSILPDNDNFTSTDATLWEQRLGLISNSSVPLVDRKLAILRKMNHPGAIPARQNYRYLERELRAAGFDVYVYENRFATYPTGYEVINPLVASGGIGGVAARHGLILHGRARHGIHYQNIIANHIDESVDWMFDIGNNLKSTFFIGYTPFGTFADVDENRKDEFRELILKIKPVQTVGFLLVNYNY